MTSLYERLPFPRLRGPAMMPEPESSAALRLAAYGLALRVHSLAYFLHVARDRLDPATLSAAGYHAASLRSYAVERAQTPSKSPARGRPA